MYATVPAFSKLNFLAKYMVEFPTFGKKQQLAHLVSILAGYQKALAVEDPIIPGTCKRGLKGRDSQGCDTGPDNSM